MPYAPFHELCPETAEKETRFLTITKDGDVPKGEYGLMESYCKVGRNEPCPCGSGKKFKRCCINK